MGLVKLGRSRINSIIHELSALCVSPDFFEKRSTGINCNSGFIHFAPEGTVTLRPHDPDHRCRHVLRGRWQHGTSGQPPAGSLLRRFIDGIFKGDADAKEKAALLQEVCGSAATGYATRLTEPRAVVLYGQTAANGKSQVLDLARGLLPPNATCSVPATRMGDERHIVGLQGALLNAADELSASSIASDTFKAVVTGDVLTGRDVYKARVEFRPLAQNVFAANILPPFRGGMDRGVQRRLLVLPFSRVIPECERVENIGQRIAKEEPNLLLAWAVEGASRLVRQRNFTIPDSCKQALLDWVCVDPVSAWIEECVEMCSRNQADWEIRTRDAYGEFRAWAAAEGFRNVPCPQTFTQRVRASIPGAYLRKSVGRYFVGMRIVRTKLALK